MGTFLFKAQKFLEIKCVNHKSYLKEKCIGLEQTTNNLFIATSRILLQKTCKDRQRIMPFMP